MGEQKPRVIVVFPIVRITKNILRQTRSNSSTTSSTSSHSASAKSGRTTAMSSKPNSIGMSKTSASGTPTSNAAHPSSTEKSSAHTDPISRSFTSFSATKVTSISRPNPRNGNGFTTLQGRTVPTTGKPLTRRSETSYSDPISVPLVRLGYSIGYTFARPYLSEHAQAEEQRTAQHLRPFSYAARNTRKRVSEVSVCGSFAVPIRAVRLGG